MNGARPKQCQSKRDSSLWLWHCQGPLRYEKEQNLQRAQGQCQPRPAQTANSWDVVNKVIAGESIATIEPSEKMAGRMFNMHKPDATLTEPTFDLNLLRFLRALADTASVTQAGQVVGISQPAASRAMARLRRHFGDPLLVRTSRGYVLTALVERLGPAVRRALSATDEIFETATFVPAHSSRRFRAACTDYGMSAVMVPCLRAFAREAPTVSLQIDAWSDETISRIERGELDCALYADEPIPPDFHFRTLFQDSYVLACRSGHPVTGFAESGWRKLLAAAARYPQFAPRYPSGRTHITDNVYRTLGLESPRLFLEAPYFYSAAQAVLASDVVAVLPQRAAKLWAMVPEFEVIPIRHDKLQFDYRLIWHERSHRDPAMAWFRDLLVRETVE